MNFFSPSTFWNTLSPVHVSVCTQLAPWLTSVVMFSYTICVHVGERQLQGQECDKTPDCRLEIPISKFIGVKP